MNLFQKLGFNEFTLPLFKWRFGGPAGNMKKHSEINWALFLDFLLQQLGKPYVFGVENNPNEDDWKKYLAWDCSEIVEVAFHKIALDLPDGSYNQAKVVKHVDIHSPLIGDLLFKWFPETQVIHHVGIFVGNQKLKSSDVAEEACILEAKGKAWGVILTPLNDFVNNSQFAFAGRHKDIIDA